MPLVKYGWTVTKIIAMSEESFLCEGGEVDGGSFGKAAIPDAEIGDVYSINLQSGGAFALGRIEKAVLLYRK